MTKLENSNNNDNKCMAIHTDIKELGLRILPTKVVLTQHEIVKLGTIQIVRLWQYLLLLDFQQASKSCTASCLYCGCKNSCIMRCKVTKLP